MRFLRRHRQVVVPLAEVEDCRSTAPVPCLAEAVDQLLLSVPLPAPAPALAQAVLPVSGK